MPHAFPSLGMLQRPVGQSPWSARVPLDPLSFRGIRYLPGRCATRGSRADEGVRPTTYRWRSEREECAASAGCVGSRADVPFGAKKCRDDSRHSRQDCPRHESGCGIWHDECSVRAKREPEISMSEHTRVSHPAYNLLPTEIEGFDSLAELALDMHWSWNHSTDEVWRQLDPRLWEITHNPWVVLQTVSRDQIERVLADPGFRKNVDGLVEAVS